jgi:hypothetical protein
MQEPNRIPLTNNPRSKQPKKFPLEKQYPEPITNENNLENNSESIQELESD